MAKRTIEQVEVTGRRVLMRVDFNVPLDGAGDITDDRRIRQSLPSIRSVLDRDGRLVLLSHLGRPSGTGVEAAFSLRPMARRLGELLGRAVGFPGTDCVADEAMAATEDMSPGEVLLLENLRFHPGEKANDEDFARRLAKCADLYCNDAFGTAHREHASLVGVPKVMADRPRVAGLMLEREIRFLRDAMSDPRRPLVAILGGAKVSDKLGAIRRLIEKADTLLVGGGAAYTLLRARGVDVGRSLVEPDLLEDAKAMLDEAGAAGIAVHLPVDHVCGRGMDAGEDIEHFDDSIGAGWMGLDIGPETIRVFTEVVQEAGTIVWYGPLGAFEVPPFEAGTRAVAEAVVEATKGGTLSILGGGDTAASVEMLGFAEGLSHVSTGGGASLALIEGRRFASVEVLDDA